MCSAMNSTECNAVAEPEDDASDSVALTFRIVGIPLGISIVVANVAFILTMTWHKTSQVRQSTQVLLVSSSNCAALAGLVLVAYSVAFPYTSSTAVVTPPSLRSLCHLWGALHLSLIVLDCLHIAIVSLDHNYVVTTAGCSTPTQRIGLAVLLGWLYAVLITLLTLAFDHLPPTQSRRGGGCDILDLDRYYELTLLIHVIAGVLCSLVVVANVRRTLDLHQRQIQVTNTITYKNLLFETRLAQLNLLAGAILVLAWLPLTVAEVMTRAGVTSKVAAVRLTFLVGNVSYLKAILYVAADREIRRDFARVATCKLPVEKNRSLSSASR